MSNRNESENKCIKIETGVRKGLSRKNVSETKCQVEVSQKRNVSK